MNSRKRTCRFSALVFAAAAFFSTTDVNAQDFEPVHPGRVLQFPSDHGIHPTFATEWWYFTGHLRTAEDRPYGFQLTFFRVGLSPVRLSESNWESPSIYLGHFALTDDKQKRFRFTERAARASFGDAGAAEGRLFVWIGGWRAEMREGSIHLTARGENESLELALKPAKPLVLQGDSGFSRKGPNPGEASYYSSFTRLEGSGSLVDHNNETRITLASVWMDHEVTSANLNPNYQGWDWFAVQLKSGEELMLYRLREKNGRASPYSSAAFVFADGSVRNLRADEFNLEPTGFWRSPRTGAEYPTSWRIQVPSLSIALTLTPTVEDQELVTSGSTGVTYWEGRAEVRGSMGETEVSGEAYEELVGYKGTAIFRP